MLRQLIAYFLVLTTLTATSSRFFIFAGFELNQKYITENLCINKSKPWLHCNGKCYYKKNISQSEESEKKQAGKDNSNRLEVSYFQEPFRLCFITPIQLDGKIASFPAYSYQYSSRYIETIFRPPKLIA